jgi:NADP oxidoreductase coenzyme F420-dependent
MRAGILGSGLMGGKLGTIFARAGHEVVFSYARSSDKLKRLARDALRFSIFALIKSVGNPPLYPLKSKVAAVGEIKPFLLAFSNQSGLLDYRLGRRERHFDKAAFIAV